MRDIFTMGARPIVSMNSLRFGSLSNDRNRFLLDHVVKGIGDYGNCLGIPTLGGEVVIEDSYAGNPLVNAMSLGVVDTKLSSGALGLPVGTTTERPEVAYAGYTRWNSSNSSMEIYNGTDWVEIVTDYFPSGSTSFG